MPPRIPGSGYGQLANNLSDMLQTYVINRAKNAMPWGIRKTVDWLTRRYFNASPGKLAQAKYLGESGYQAGKKSMARFNEVLLRRDEIPVDRTLPRGTAYRAVTVIKHIDPRTGVKSYATMIMDFDRNPTAADYIAKIASQAPALMYFSADYGRAGLSTSELAGELKLDNILGVWRRTT